MRYATKLGKSLIALVIACVVCLWGCSSKPDIDCYNAFDKTPKKLLAENEYVVLGDFVAVDTLVELEKLEELSNGVEYFLLQYAIRPSRTLKSPSEDSLVLLWYISSWSQKHMHDSGLRPKTGSKDLIYGKAIKSPEEVGNCVLTRVPEDDRSSFPETVHYLNSTGAALARRIRNLGALSDRLRESRERGPVLWATDYLYRTHDSYHYGVLACCDSTSLEARWYTSEEYLEELESLID